MSLSFIIGGAGSGKSHVAYTEIVKRAEANPKQNFFVIVPDQYSLEAMREIVALSSHKGIMNIDVCSFARLAHRLFDNPDLNRTVLNDTGKSLCLRLVAGRMEDELVVLKDRMHKPGYIHQVKSAISEFMQYNLTPADVERLANSLSEHQNLKAKLLDLARIYAAFKTYLSDSFITTEETMQVLADRLPNAALMQGSVVVLDGFTGFTPVQERVVEQMLQVCEEVTVTALVSRHVENPHAGGEEQDLFRLSTKMIQKLEKFARENQIPVKPDVRITEYPVVRHANNHKKNENFKSSHAGNAAMAYLEDVLFQKECTHSLKEAPNPEGITILHCTNPDSEIRQVAREIKRLVNSGEYEYREIAVLTGALNDYAPTVEKTFEEMGIAYFLDRKTEVVLNPFIEYLKAGLEVAVNRYSYDSVMNFLRLGFVDFKREEIDRFENYILALGIRGKSLYESGFTRMSKEIRKKPEELLSINQTRQKLVDYISIFSKDSATVGEYTKMLYEYMLYGKAEARVQELETRFKEAGNLRDAAIYRQIYTKMVRLLETIYNLIGNETVTIKEYYELLGTALAENSVGSIPTGVDRVMVGDMERTRLTEVKVLFFVGVNDGIIPKKSDKGGIISDLDREFLQTVEIDVPTAKGVRKQTIELAPGPRQKVFTQQLYLYMNLTKPTDRLFVSYCNLNRKGNSIRKSYFVDVLSEIFQGKLKETTEEILCPDNAMTYGEVAALLARGLGQANAENWAGDYSELLLYKDALAGEQNPHKMQNLPELLFRAALPGKTPENIPAALASLIYGASIQANVSRLEDFAACAYAHFLRNGLRLSQRETYAIRSTDLGNLYHNGIEQFSKGLKKDGKNWLDFEDDYANERVETIVERFATDPRNGILNDSDHNRYILTRMKRILGRTLKTMRNQLQGGQFVPTFYEHSFENQMELDPTKTVLTSDEHMKMVGRIDRVDFCEEEEKVYVKVVDYKTYDSDISLYKVYYGAQLQLVAYSNAVLRDEQKKRPDKEYIAAGLLYYRIADPMCKEDEVAGGLTEENIEASIRKKLAMKGIVNTEADVLTKFGTETDESGMPVSLEIQKDCCLNSEQMEILSAYTEKKIHELTGRIVAGEIGRHPQIFDGKSPCDRCVYYGTCGVKDSELVIPDKDEATIESMVTALGKEEA